MSTVTETCKFGNSSCSIDFECEECVSAWMEENNPERLKSVLWNSGLSTMESIREFGEGSGGKSRSGPDNSATDKQIAFIAKLAGERGVSVPEVNSKSEANVEIERLLTLPVINLFGRWSKVNGQWVVRIASVSLNPGDTVTVRKSSGQEQEVILGELVQTSGGETFWSLKKETGEKATVYEPGMYRTEDDRIVKVKMNRAKTSVYGSVHDGDEWVYTPGITREKLIRLTVEEAAAYGKLYGQCIVCCRELTNPESIERGIGPICINKI